MEENGVNRYGGGDDAVRASAVHGDDAWGAFDDQEVLDGPGDEEECARFYDTFDMVDTASSGLEVTLDSTSSSAAPLPSDCGGDVQDEAAAPENSADDAFWLLGVVGSAISNVEAQGGGSEVSTYDMAHAIMTTLMDTGMDEAALQANLFDTVGDFEAVASILSHKAGLQSNATEILRDLTSIGYQDGSSAYDAANDEQDSRPLEMFHVRDKGKAKAKKFMKREQRRMQKRFGEIQVSQETTGPSVSRQETALPVGTPQDPIQKMEEAIQTLRRTTISESLRTAGGEHRALPVGSERVVHNGYEEVSVPATHGGAREKSAALVKVSEQLDPFAQRAFAGVETLNRVQSEVFVTAYRTNENMLVCAPTGAGKTNVALLTVLHEIGLHIDQESSRIDLDSFKVVYVAPMKALAAEVVDKFSARLNPLGIQVRELTGDMQLTRSEAAATQVLVVTPEKWDVITRKAIPGNGNPTTDMLKLLIIDEVHLLHDDRGSVLESIVARTLRTVESQQSMIRLVGLSATLPNYVDVASFLRVNPSKGLFFFDASFRPVPLAQQFIGVSVKDKKKRAELSLKLCYEKVALSMRADNQVMVFVHTRKATARTARDLLELSAQDEEGIPLFVPGQVVSKAKKSSEPIRKFYEEDPSVVPKIPDWAVSEIAKAKSADVRELCMRGIGVHHAGLLRPDRKLVERLFTQGVLRCLVCTATLAWGVNLPAHTVVIYGTEIYDPHRGGYVDIGMLDVMQIFGRAGRPQFDTEGEGVIITTHEKLSHYLRLLTASLPIESQLSKGSSLIDHLNAEIVLGSVSNIKEGVEWMGYTYMGVRMQKNPLVYGVEWEVLRSDPQLRGRREEMIRLASKSLDDSRMARFDPVTGALGPTDLGRVASHFYVSHGTIVLWNESLKPDMNEEELLKAVSSATEFEDLTVREEELHEIASLKKLACPFKVLGGFDTTAGKANVLLQARISRAPLKNFTLVSDSNFVYQNASRLMQAVFEIAVKRGWPVLCAIALDFCKALDNDVWAFQHPLRQLSRTVQLETSARLEQAGDLGSLDSLLLMTHGEITSLVRSPKVANSVSSAARSIPRLKVEARVSPLARTILRIDVQLDPSFTWSDSIHGSGAAAAEHFYLWVEDCEQDRIYHVEKVAITRKARNATQNLVILVPVFDPPSQQYAIRVLSSKWHGGDSYSELSLREMVLPGKLIPHTQLLDLRPLPRTALRHEKFESLYRFSHFNPIQTQVFHTLYHKAGNVLVGAPTGSGKTVLAELAMLRCFRESPGLKVVYIGPLKALVRERVLDWQRRLVGGLGISLVELTGDKAPDATILQKATVICTTPEKWDGVSRDWQSRKFVRDVRLVVLDEVHLLGGDRGPVLEVIVSRTRRTNPECRFVALSTALANAHEMADWLAVDPRDGMFNFRPSVRPVPCETHILGVAGEHYCPRMNAMNRPTFSSILRYSESKPVLVFVSSRRQTRLTALELIRLAAAEGNPRRFAHGPAAVYEDAVVRIRDAAFKQTVEYGVGLHHAGLPDSDRMLAEELFLSGNVQVLVSTSTLAWGVNLPAHLVIIKGTEFFDARQNKYVDMPITDILQMMGRAGRPQFDDRAFAVILVQDSKKSFYKKFLYDPFPVESALHEQLHDHINAEIAGGTIRSGQDAVDYLTWTYLSRRIMTNPSYYGLSGATPEVISGFLCGTVERILMDLKESRCIDVRLHDYEVEEHQALEDSRKVEPSMLSEARNVTVALSSTEQKSINVKSTLLGQVAAKFYISHRTAATLDDRMKAELSIEYLIRILTECDEFGELPVRHNEEKVNEQLAQNLVECLEKFNNPRTVRKELEKKYFIFHEAMASPHMKARLLLLALFTRVRLPMHDYLTDTRTVLDNSSRIVQAMMSIAAERSFWTTTKNVILLAQMLVQGVWFNSPVFQNLPLWNDDVADSLKRSRITTIDKLLSLQPTKLESLGSNNADGIRAIRDSAARLPRASLSNIQVIGLRDDGNEDSFWNGARDRRVRVNVDVRCVRGSGSVRQPRNGAAPEVISGSPAFKRGAKEGWYIVVADAQSNAVLALKRIAGFEGKRTLSLQVNQADLQQGTTQIHLLSDCYVGLDSMILIQHRTDSLNSNRRPDQSPPTESSGNSFNPLLQRRRQ